MPNESRHRKTRLNLPITSGRGASKPDRLQTELLGRRLLAQNGPETPKWGSSLFLFGFLGGSRSVFCVFCLRGGGGGKGVLMGFVDSTPDAGLRKAHLRPQMQRAFITAWDVPPYTNSP